MRRKAYQSMAELVLNERMGIDYEVVVRDASARSTILAIHGGAIEPPTGELARAVAGAEHNLFVLAGLDAARSPAMRVMPFRFREMRADGLLRRSSVAISIIAGELQDEQVRVGGQNAALNNLIVKALNESGFPAAEPAFPAYVAMPQQLHNRSRTGGAQIELPVDLLSAMRAADDRDAAPLQNTMANCFVEAVRTAIVTHQAHARGDLGDALRRYERDTGRIPDHIRASSGRPDETD